MRPQFDHRRRPRFQAWNLAWVSSTGGTLCGLSSISPLSHRSAPWDWLRTFFRTRRTKNRMPDEGNARAEATPGRLRPSRRWHRILRPARRRKDRRATVGMAEHIALSRRHRWSALRSRDPPRTWWIAARPKMKPGASLRSNRTTCIRESNLIEAISGGFASPACGAPYNGGLMQSRRRQHAIRDSWAA